MLNNAVMHIRTVHACKHTLLHTVCACIKTEHLLVIWFTNTQVIGRYSVLILSEDRGSYVEHKICKKTGKPEFSCNIVPSRCNWHNLH
jgi:hypothetical protein